MANSAGKASIRITPGTTILTKPPLLKSEPLTVPGFSLSASKNQLFFGLISLLSVVGAGFVLFSSVPALLTAGYSILTGALILSGIVFVIANVYQLAEKSASGLQYIYTIVPYLFLVSVIISVLALHASYGDIVERDIVKIPIIRNINSLFIMLIVAMVGYHLYHQTHAMDIHVIPRMASLSGIKEAASSIGSNDIVYFIIMLISLTICAVLLNTMYSQIMYHTTDG